MLIPKATTWKGLREIIKNTLDDEYQKRQQEALINIEKLDAEKAQSVTSEYKPGGLFYIDKESFEATSNKSNNNKNSNSKLSIAKSPKVKTNSGRFMLMSSPKQNTEVK